MMQLPSGASGPPISFAKIPFVLVPRADPPHSTLCISLVLIADADLWARKKYASTNQESSSTLRCWH
jgi:hypothetical protein